MARARNIKPGFYKNEDLAECSIWARFIFPGLWMLADREGRLEDRPKRIKGELLPFDSHEAEPLLRELEARGFIVRYEAEGTAYIQIVAFYKHQNPHHREPESTIPPPQSLGLLPDARTPKPEALGSCDDSKARGKPEASPRQDPPKSDLARGVNPADSLIPDSGFLIPDSTPLSVAAASELEPVPRDPKPDAAALPRDPIAVRSIELAAMLRKRGAALQASDPRVREWAEAGVTDAQALAALDVAESRRANQANPQPVNAGLLNAILRDPPQCPVAPPNGRPRPPTLTETRAATIAALTGKPLPSQPHERTERDITGEAQRLT